MANAPCARALRNSSTAGSPTGLAKLRRTKIAADLLVVEYDPAQGFEPLLLAVRQEFSGVLGEIKKDHAGLAELLTSVSEHRRFAHLVDVLAVVRCALNASFEEIDVHRLPVRAYDAEHQGRAVAVTRLGEAIKLIFGHVLRSLIVHGGKRY